MTERLTRKPKPKVRLMLDSGAYTAWTQGIEINLKEYMAFLKANKDEIHTYFNLDVIPGKPGEKRTADIVEASAKQSFLNLQTMKKAGLTPIPVYHYGEREYWLDKMLDAGEKYIAFGGNSWAQSEDVRPWLDRIFTKLTDKSGKPLIRTHGLGVASWDLVKRYPWYTCDATSWALTAAYGSIYVPRYSNGQPDYSANPVKLSVSTVERQKGVSLDHYLRLGRLGQERVKDFLENHVNTSIEDVSQDYVARASAVVYFNERFSAAIGDDPRFQHRIKMLTS